MRNEPWALEVHPQTKVNTRLKKGTLTLCLSRFNRWKSSCCGSNIPPPGPASLGPPYAFECLRCLLMYHVPYNGGEGSSEANPGDRDFPRKDGSKFEASDSQKKLSVPGD
jgi:hypothetical protein